MSMAELSLSAIKLFLSDILPGLFEKLTSPELLEFATQDGVRSKLKKWEEKLTMIKAVLNNVEQKQLEFGPVWVWLKELQDLAEDAKNILDEYATEALTRKQKIKEHQATTSWALKLIPACCISRTPSALPSDISMRSKIDDITFRLQNLCKEATHLELDVIDGGREDDKAKILEMVLTNEPGVANFDVIPIVGMGLIGKTTLAQQVLRDKKVEDFNIKAWVPVPHDFDVLRISKEILEAITRSSCDMKELGAVQNQLKEALNGKRFLIVLDDVQSMDNDLWERLKAPFLAGAPGSKVIVTTRKYKVALAMRPRKYYRLKLLSDDDCWAIFVKRAFDFRDDPTDWNLNIIREKVVQTCRGLPLPAKHLGDILYDEAKEDDERMNILNSERWGLDSKIWNLNMDIFSWWRLRYENLPSHLKECFAYCSIFPPGYEFEKKDLVSSWREQGLIQQSNKDLQLEDLGGHYFNDLLSGSFFQISSSNTSKFVMDDIIYDLAQMVSERFNGKKWNGNNGGDDDNNGGGGGKNNKKGNRRDGDSNGDKDKRGHDHGGGEMKGKNMNGKGEAMFGYRFTYHAGTENGYPIGQLRCIREVQSLISLFYRAVMIC